MTQVVSPSTGSPVDLPPAVTGPTSKSRSRSPFWEHVAEIAAENEGKWIPVTPPGKSSAADIAANIRSGRIASLRDHHAVSRQKTLYVSLNPTQQPD